MYEPFQFTKQFDYLEKQAKEEEDKTESELEARIKRRNKPDPQKDITVKRALEWLKSGISVAKYKEDHKPQKKDNTAWYMKGS